MKLFLPKKFSLSDLRKNNEKVQKNKLDKLSPKLHIAEDLKYGDKKINKENKNK